MGKSFYEHLGVQPDADEATIKKAYRRLALEHHPDRVQDRATNERRLSEDQIRVLNEAYSVLMKKERRELYDRCLETGKDFNAVEQDVRPESDAEREVREAAEQHLVQAMEASIREAVQGIQGLPGVWRNEPEKDDYFDAVLAGKQGPSKYTVHLKVLAELGPEDVPGIAEYAEALTQMAPRGLIREQHAYLLIGRTIRDARVLHSRIELFNARAWTGAPPRSARAFLAYMGIAEGVILAPGATAPEPALPSLRLRLMRHFRF